MRIESLRQPQFSRVGIQGPAFSSTSAIDRSALSFPVWLALTGGLLIFSPLLEGGTTHQAVMVIRLTVLVLFGFYLTKALRGGRLLIPRLSIGLPILTYFVLAVVSTALSSYTHQSVQWLVVLLTYVLLLYLIVFFVERWNHVATLLLIVTGIGMLQAIVALMQGWAGSARPHGTFFNPNFLAGYLAAVWCIVFSAACYRPALCRSDRRVMGLIGGTLVLLLAAIVWTGSRGGLLAFLAGTAVVLGLRFRWRGVTALVLLCMVCIVIPNPVRDRVLTEHFDNPLGYGRLQIWQSSIHAMLERPTGFGLGLYQYVYPRYATPIDAQIARYGKSAQTAHSEYLQMGVELGIVSVLLFFWGVACLAREAQLTLNQRLHRWQRAIVVGTIAGVLGVLVHAAVDSNLHEPAIAILLTVNAGIVLSTSRLTRPYAKADRTVPVGVGPRWLVAAMAFLMIGFLMAGVLRLGLGWMAYEAGSRAGDFTEAIARYETAIDLDPGKSLYHSALGAVYFKRFGRTHEQAAATAALTELKKAIELNPLDGRLPGLLGHVYLILSALPSASGDPAQITSLHAARSAYERAAALEPFMPSHRLALGQIQLALGDPRAAEEQVQHAIMIEPNFLPAREWLVRRYVEAGRVEDAVREYDEIVRRQDLYASRPKDKLEERYLTVDDSSLHSVIETLKRRT